MNTVGEMTAELRVVPTNQRFTANNLAGSQFDFWLVHQTKFFVGNSRVQWVSSIKRCLLASFISCDQTAKLFRPDSLARYMAVSA